MPASGWLLLLAIAGLAVLVWWLRRWLSPYLEEAIAVRQSQRNGEPYEPLVPLSRRASWARHHGWQGMLLAVPLLPFIALADGRVWLRELWSDCAEARGAETRGRALQLLIVISHISWAPNRIWIVWRGRGRRCLHRLYELSLDGRLVYRLVFAIDIEDYHLRDAYEQQRAQLELDDSLGAAADRAGLDRSRWVEEGRSAGEIAVLPEDVDILRVVDVFTRELEAELGKLNARHPTARPLRVRLALHHGTLAGGPFGPVGDAPVVVNRLLNIDKARTHLERFPERTVALIVSSAVYDNVIRTGYCSAAPADFERFEVDLREKPCIGYLY